MTTTSDVVSVTGRLRMCFFLLIILISIIVCLIQYELQFTAFFRTMVSCIGKDMSNKTIIEFLNEYMKDPAVSFHMPGHKGRSDIFEKTGYSAFLRNMVTCDITEIPGADALFCPETTLRSVMDNYAELYGAKHTELLVNGSSAGVMAAIIGCVPVGGKLILGRNSHHSAFSALRLGGINPVYVRPGIEPYSGLTGEISPEALKQVCKANPDAEAVLITSPNYYGMLSDIAALATVAHDYGMILIVDQAHGAHLKFFDDDAESIRDKGGYVPFPRHAAEALGADIVINSTHKTLLSFTGSGIMNICSDRVDISAVSDALRMLQTTSPSYLLLAGLDINERIMREHGHAVVRGWREDLFRFYRKALRINGVRIAGGRMIAEALKKGAEVVKQAAADNDDPKYADVTAASLFPMYHSRTGLDMTKINISMSELGISGEQLDKELRLRGIISEMVHGEYVMLMTGAGSRSSDYDCLLAALQGISDSYGISRPERQKPRPAADFVLETAGVPFEAMSVPLYEADGMILYDPVIVYPPGTPIACPGEILTLDVISFISEAIGRGEKVTGVDEEGMIRVELAH